MEDPEPSLFIAQEDESDDNLEQNGSVAPTLSHHAVVAKQEVSDVICIDFEPNAVQTAIAVSQDIKANPLKRVRAIGDVETEEGVCEPAWSRFIGSLMVQAWATRPTVKPLNYKEHLIIKRLTPKDELRQDEVE